MAAYGEVSMATVNPSCRDFVGEEIEGIVTSRSYTYDLCPRYATARLQLNPCKSAQINRGARI
jgi:hypothetical protein